MSDMEKVLVTQEEHAKNLTDICDLLVNLKKGNNAFRDLIPCFYKLGEVELADHFSKYTHNVDIVLSNIDSLVIKHYREEAEFAQRDCESIKHLVEEVNKSLNNR